MPRKPKGTGPAAPRPGFAAISRLVGREPLLADAARLEADLGRLCLRLAKAAGPGPDAPRWRQAARLSRAVAEGLSDLAAAVSDPPHHPRPTRLRVSTLQAADLTAAVARVAEVRATLNGPASPAPAHADLIDLWTLEARAVAAPLCRLFALCPTPPVVVLWRNLAARRQVLEPLAVAPAATNGNGAMAWPDPPAHLARPVRPLRAGGNGHPGPPPTPSPSTPTTGPEWTAAGCVERLNRARRCGTARTEDGRSVFFGAQAVYGGLAALHTGDPVTLRLRRGPLGLAAVRVTPRPGPGPDAVPPPVA